MPSDCNRYLGAVEAALLVQVARVLRVAWLRPAAEAWSPAAEGGAGETSRGRLWKLGSGLQALRAVEWAGAGEGEEG